MKYIASFSGGKDSCATVILAHQNRKVIPLDEIIFVEVMYDIKRNISGELPQHIDFIRNVAMPTFEDWGYKTTILRGEKDYLGCFFHVIENARKYPEHNGMYNGFPINKRCCVKRDCKIYPIERYMRTLGKAETYVGIAADEPSRLVSLHRDSTKKSLLEVFGYTEQMAFELCDRYGLLSPSYQYSKRGGCWFCPNAGICENMATRSAIPEIWDEFIRLEEGPNLAFKDWNCFSKETLKQRERRLAAAQTPDLQTIKRGR